MKGRTPTRREAQHMAKAADFGCCICRWFYGVMTPAAIHHIDGKTKPDAHLLTIGLCPKHHQQPDNNKPKRWQSRHGDGRAAFEREYAPELELLERLKNEY